MQKNIYKLAWFLSPILFLIVYAVKGQTCLMGSCTGNNNAGIAYGLGAVIIYFLILKFFKHGSQGISKEFWSMNGVKSGFFFILLILVVIMVYFLGKTNQL